MYKFGKSSKEQLGEVHELLRLLANACLRQSAFDFGVLAGGGLRSASQQKELFAQGASKHNGTKKKSHHQYGMALDLVPHINGSYTWVNKEAFLNIAQSAFSIWGQLEDTQGLHLHWGGFWKINNRNKKGFLDLQEIQAWDLSHFELRSKAQKEAMPIDTYLAKMNREIV